MSSRPFGALTDFNTSDQRRRMCDIYQAAVFKILNPRSSYTARRLRIDELAKIYQAIKQYNLGRSNKYLYEKLAGYHSNDLSSHEWKEMVKSLQKYFAAVVTDTKGEKRFVDFLVDAFLKWQGRSYERDGMFALTDSLDSFESSNESKSIDRLIDWKTSIGGDYNDFPKKLLIESCTRRGYIDVVETMILYVEKMKIGQNIDKILNWLIREFNQFNQVSKVSKDDRILLDLMLRKLVQCNLCSLYSLTSIILRCLLPDSRNVLMFMLVSIFGPRVVIGDYTVIVPSDYLDAAMLEYQAGQDKLIEAMISPPIDLPECLAKISLEYL
jgi:hypothetical protein